MHNFKYEIKYTEKGKPYINIPPDFEQKPEHWFMIYEMARYGLYDLVTKNEKTNGLTNGDVIKIGEAGYIIQQIAETFGELLREVDINMDDIKKILNKDLPNNDK